MQLFLGVMIVVFLVAITVWVNILDREENQRRALLPAAVRKRLEEEDACWSQRFGF